MTKPTMSRESTRRTITAVRLASPLNLANTASAAIHAPDNYDPTVPLCGVGGRADTERTFAAVTCQRCIATQARHVTDDRSYWPAS